MHSEQSVSVMAHLAGEVVEIALAGRAVGMRLLLAEMQALQRVMPGAPDPGPKAADAAQALAFIDEAGFDNMPV